jgi:hypothetical protein
MKTLKILFLLAVIALGSTACRKGSIWGVRGKGPNITRTKDISGFSFIKLNCDADIVYTQDNAYFVEITGQENILNILETKVTDSQLKIDFLREVRSHNGLTINIHTPVMTGMSIDGSGNFTAQGTVTADNIGLYINGSGNITLPALNSNNIDCKIAGSGDVNLKGGTGKSASYNISGSGNIYAIDMPCQDASIRVSGSGNVSVNAANSLKIVVSGSGDVRYKGNPIIDSQIGGSGKLIHVQ